MFQLLAALPLLATLTVPFDSTALGDSDGPRDYSLFKKLPFASCKIGPRFYNWDTCEGYVNRDYAKDDTYLAGWIRSLTWHAMEDEAKRAPAAGADSVVRRVRAIVDPEEYRLPDLARLRERGLVIGKITVDASGAFDKYYRIGGPGFAGFAPDFYFVVDRIVSNGRSDSIRYERGHWTLYGVSGGRLRATTVNGTLWECKHVHDDATRKKGATFSSCATMRDLAPILSRPEVRRALGNAPLMQSLQAWALNNNQLTPTGTALNRMLSDKEKAVMLTALRESFDAPFWTACGTGCCTAEI